MKIRMANLELLLAKLERLTENPESRPDSKSFAGIGNTGKICERLICGSSVLNEYGGTSTSTLLFWAAKRFRNQISSVEYIAVQ